MRLVVGLGNPGERYRRTRHNVGFMVVDALSSGLHPRQGREDGAAWVLDGEIAGTPALLVKPLTFMNRSGQAVADLLDRNGLAPESLVVVMDDVALDLGALRIRERGSHGGHNGLRSIVDVLGTEEFPRVRIGVGRKDVEGDLAEYVLAPFPDEDVLVVHEVVGRAADAVRCLLREGAGTAMNRYNGPPKRESPEP
jgi:PTH1 family peptidyl-tRNA hydrolase